MHSISKGFYEKLQVLRQTNPHEDFGFLNDLEIHNDFNIYDFLHGLCNYFATILNKTFGYEMQSIYDEDNELVHVYCIHKDKENNLHFIDVRGCTTDFQLFISEFENFITITEDEPIDIRPYEPNAKLQKIYLDIGMKIIQQYRDYYIPKSN